LAKAIDAAFDPRTGALSFDGFPVRLGRGFREAGMKRLASMKLKRSTGERLAEVGGKLVEVPSIDYETPPVMLGGRRAKLYLSFRTGVLMDVSVAIVGLEWWTRKGHRQNVALRKRLFPRGRTFDGGTARVVFEKGFELYDGGSQFDVHYDPPAKKVSRR
jgi:hypothetical protein